MTIFQKMLVVPIISLVFYFGLLVYSYSVQSESNEQLAKIKDDFMPLMNQANENSRIFNEISVVIKDAVLANELYWLEQAQSQNQQIIANLNLFKSHPDWLNMEDIEQMETAYKNYFDNAFQLAKLMLSEQSDPEESNRLMNDVTQYFNTAERAFTHFDEKLSNQFYQAIDQTNQRVNNLLFWGGIISVALLMTFIMMTLAVSWATRKSMARVVVRMKALAEGNTDFAQRIEHSKRDEVGELVYWFNQLSNKLEQDYNRIDLISKTDKLTQLNNRTHTDDYLTQCLQMTQSNKQPLSLILLDIDHFKAINDNHGHLAGDAVLKGLAELLKSQMGDGMFVGRWGGEEFIVVLPDTEAIKAEKVAEQIRLAIASNGHFNPSITASFGVASAHSEDTVDSLIKKADDALYQAKEQGRNRVVSYQIQKPKQL
ncbi:MAG: diguanylate cyclase [Marinicella sp.]